VIPELDDDGYLPPGAHEATLEELIAFFGGGSDPRGVIADSLRWLVPLCVDAGITRIAIDGSFTTGAAEPNDADCALMQGPGYRLGSEAARGLREGHPFLTCTFWRKRTIISWFARSSVRIGSGNQRASLRLSHDVEERA